MSSYKIKPCGLTSTDLSSFRSILKLSRDSLHHQWKIVSEEDADLYIYCLDYQAGISAWEQRVKGLSCLLVSNQNSASSDITLKKPLRVKIFSETLNSLDDKLPTAEIQQESVNIKTETLSKQSPSFLSSMSQLSGRLSKIRYKKNPSTELETNKEKSPESITPLKLHTPKQNDKNSEVALNETLLLHWLEALPDESLNSKIILLLNSLINFNQTRITGLERLHLLDIYRNTIKQLIVDIYPNSKKHNIKQSINKQIINNLGQMTFELANGYKIIITEEHNKGLKPDSDNLLLMAINRTGEQLNYTCRHAYKYYKTVPNGIFSELNELYLLTESVQADSTKPTTIKNSRAEYSFGHLYKQLLLVSIISPYNLNKDDVLKVYDIMNKLAPEAKILAFESNKKITSSHFIINHLNDRPPSQTLKTTDQETISPQTRIFNTHAVLTAIEDIFQSAKQSTNEATTNIALLKKIVPHLNTSYQRKEPRVKIPEERYIYLVPGFSKSHNYCGQKIQNLPDKNTRHLNKPWKVLNQSTDGFLIGSDNINCQDFLVGDIACLFEKNSTKPEIACIRWLQTDNNQFTKIGLELIHDQVKSIQVYSDKQPKPQPAILLSVINGASSIISHEGVYVEKQSLYIIDNNETFMINMINLLESSPYFERFTCGSLDSLKFD